MSENQNFTGWQCPKCGLIISPWITYCQRCAEYQAQNTAKYPDDFEN